MRNLHLDGVRSNTPWLIELLHDFGVQVDPKNKKDEQIIRRLLMGENIKEAKPPIRSKVQRNKDIPCESFYGKSLEDMLGSVRAEVLTALKAEGIDEADVIEMGIEAQDGSDFCWVAYKGLETDKELAERQRYADTWNAIFNQIDEIYARIDATLAARCAGAT